MGTSTAKARPSHYPRASPSLLSTLKSGVKQECHHPPKDHETLVPQAGVEPATFRLGGGCSIR